MYQTISSRSRWLALAIGGASLVIELALLCLFAAGHPQAPLAPRAGAPAPAAVEPAAEAAGGGGAVLLRLIEVSL